MLSERSGPWGITIVIRPAAKGAIMHAVAGRVVPAMAVKRGTLKDRVVARGRHLL